MAVMAIARTDIRMGIRMDTDTYTITHIHTTTRTITIYIPH